jgi:hypothetical protein
MRGEVVIAYISLTQDFQKQAESVDIGRFVTPQASSNRPSRRYAKAQEAASGWLIDERA